MATEKNHAVPDSSSGSSPSPTRSPRGPVVLALRDRTRAVAHTDTVHLERLQAHLDGIVVVISGMDSKAGEYALSPTFSAIDV
ncbi:hypothetical protein PanWU01x14_151130 [Parasponia andersonii]|uniref:Uncharacterized protein n=1 Tax=Parasponia andersonii TaxID=3476 RepID=A0A2P5CI84_PARAD|nr:hypothetical protein PanWU01x14_151130 [Parasponia andersonii]